MNSNISHQIFRSNEPKYLFHLTLGQQMSHLSGVTELLGETSESIMMLKLKHN